MQLQSYGTCYLHTAVLGSVLGCLSIYTEVPVTDKHASNYGKAFVQPRDHFNIHIPSLPHAAIASATASSWHSSNYLFVSLATRDFILFFLSLA
jgi:hypothetical protein